jgi:hypothetical protein
MLRRLSRKLFFARSKGAQGVTEKLGAAIPQRRIGSMQNAPNPYHMPPRATVIASPFTPPAASLHKNAITCATSRGSSTRF